METLSEWVPERLAEAIAAQLPREIGEHLRPAAPRGRTGTGDQSGRSGFVSRVAGRTGVGNDQAADMLAGGQPKRPLAAGRST
jgi:hypothetical protein